MRAEYDFSGGGRGKYAARYAQESAISVNDTTPSLLAPQEVEVKNALTQTIAELHLISADIQQRQVTIDRLKAESQLITAHTDALLSRLCVRLDTLEAAK